MRWYCVVRFFKECVLKKVMCHFVYCVYVLYVCVGVCMYVCMYTYIHVCTCQSAIVFNGQGDFGDDTRYIRIDEMK